VLGVGGVNHLRVLKSMPIELYVADCHDQRLSSADRLFKSFRDLLAVRWMKSRQIRYEIAESND
jgi:hypothetical protein